MLNIFLQISFYALTFPVNVRIFSMKFDSFKKINISKLVSVQKLVLSRNVRKNHSLYRGSLKLEWTLTL